MNRPGDWNCRSCNHLNFQRRDSCQKCGDPRQSGGVTDYSAIFGGVRMTGISPFSFTTGPDVRPGDWYCNVRNCGAHNFASRSSCFKCGALKDELPGGGFDTDFGRGRGLIGSSGSSSGRSGWKSGDWICSSAGLNAMSITLQAEWSVSGATHLEILQEDRRSYHKLTLMILVEDEEVDSTKRMEEIIQKMEIWKTTAP